MIQFTSRIGMYGLQVNWIKLILAKTPQNVRYKWGYLKDLLWHPFYLVKGSQPLNITQHSFNFQLNSE